MWEVTTSIMPLQNNKEKENLYKYNENENNGELTIKRRQKYVQWWKAEEELHGRRVGGGGGEESTCIGKPYKKLLSLTNLIVARMILRLSFELNVLLTDHSND